MSVLTNETHFASSLTGSWEGQRVGFVDLTLWDFVPFICDPDPTLINQQPLTLDGDDALELLWSEHLVLDPRLKLELG
ncbi:uncharacterized protein N7487_011484 [Penicillium crustosum]|uniref:uncharacterized protein n=1 Tax=Penicillium crustosum TaxID=36656 RepID=UPI00239505D6|nr:uncharacterized protein N7487_011484 [Penicillium crustosum]KAJ5393843.1 hypothetical protein N7487_011484 [Penicillium crustosum]